jgi:hypothetical protein
MDAVMLCSYENLLSRGCVISPQGRMEEPTEGEPRGHPQKMPRVPWRMDNARVRVDALEEILSCSVLVEMY